MVKPRGKLLAALCGELFLLSAFSALFVASESAFVAILEGRNWTCDTEPVRSIFLLILFHLLLTPVFADSSLQSARHARALLGADTWSRVIEIENTNRHSVYPRKLYALIFEFSGILWFYTETDGTQSFSLWSNRLELEKADFREGLRQIDPGFIQYSAVEDKDALPLQSGKLPNGCWIKSFVAGRKQIAQDQSIREARLVM